MTLSFWIRSSIREYTVQMLFPLPIVPIEIVSKHSLIHLRAKAIN